MFRFLLPTILIGAAVAGFFIITDPLYSGISLERDQIASYNTALDNSKALEAQRDMLTQKYNSFDPSDLTKLQTLLPDNVDNIRLILEIENVAAPYGMVLKDVKYNATGTGTTTPETAGVVQGGGSPTDNKDYGTWDLEFSTQGSYNNFISFLKDLESNLRIVDISSIQFSSSATGTNTGLSSASQTYNYDFSIRTYWLKN